MTSPGGVDRLALLTATARVWRRTTKEAEAAREAFDDAILQALDAGNSQRSVARAADISEPLVRKIKARRVRDHQEQALPDPAHVEDLRARLDEVRKQSEGDQ